MALRWLLTPLLRPNPSAHLVQASVWTRLLSRLVRNALFRNKRRNNIIPTNYCIRFGHAYPRESIAKCAGLMNWRGGFVREEINEESTFEYGAQQARKKCTERGKVGDYNHPSCVNGSTHGQHNYTFRTRRISFALVSPSLSSRATDLHQQFANNARIAAIKWRSSGR